MDWWEKKSAAGLTLPLSSDQTLHLMSNLAGDVISAAVTAAVKDQLAGVRQALSQAAPTGPSVHSRYVTSRLVMG